MTPKKTAVGYDLTIPEGFSVDVSGNTLMVYGEAGSHEFDIGEVVGVFVDPTKSKKTLGKDSEHPPYPRPSIGRFALEPCSIEATSKLPESQAKGRSEWAADLLRNESRNQVELSIGKMKTGLKRMGATVIWCLWYVPVQEVGVGVDDGDVCCTSITKLSMFGVRNGD